MASRPLGTPVTAPPAQLPTDITLNGRTVEIVRLKASHADDLYSHVTDPSLWDYMPQDVPKSLPDFRAMFTQLAASADPFLFAIIDKRPPSAGYEATTYEKPVGYFSLLRMTPEHLSVEIGHVLFSPVLQKTICATEALYLLLRYAFDTLGYRRVEWKCNSFNEGSRRAALRYGFTYEGTFRQHMVVKGRNRDTAWFSMLREEWDGGIKAAMEGWLDPGNFDDNGRQRSKLEDIRNGLQLKN
ncbi:acyl-CoA N-acyltransferase [Aspergillus floccosus]